MSRYIPPRDAKELEARVRRRQNREKAMEARMVAHNDALDLVKREYTAALLDRIVAVLAAADQDSEDYLQGLLSDDDLKVLAARLRAGVPDADLFNKLEDHEQ